MANSVTFGRRTITIVPDGVTDFDVTTYFPNGIRLSAIDWRPSLTNDRTIIREKLATGKIIYDRTDVGGGGLHHEIGGKSLRRKVYIKASEQTWNTPGDVKIFLEFD